MEAMGLHDIPRTAILPVTATVEDNEQHFHGSVSAPSGVFRDGGSCRTAFLCKTASFPKELSVENPFPEVRHVLVTGGCGYLGSVLVPMLLEKFLRVTVYDNLTFGIQGLAGVLGNHRLRVVQGDILDRKHLLDVMANVDAVVHLAAIVGYPACDAEPKLAVSVNEDGSGNVVACLQPHQRLVYSSTGSCYGIVQGICSEASQISPLTLYGRTKANGEKVVREAGGVALRLATVFGDSPRMRLDLLVNDLTYRAMTAGKIQLYEGHCRRTFLHVRDAARAFMLALEKFPDIRGEAFNVGDEKLNINKADIGNMLEKLLPGVEVSVMAGEDKDKRDYEVCYAKIRKLGFRAEIGIEEGMRELIETLPRLTDEQIKGARNA